MKDIKLSKEIEELILSKEYEFLNLEEKAIVNSLITVEEYHNFRNILLTVNEIKQEDTLTNTRKDFDSLMTAFDKSHNVENKKGIGRKILEYTLPLYKVAAGMLLILTASYIINMKFFPSSHERIVFLTDTIYKEVLVPESIWLADSSIKADYYKTDITSIPTNGNYDRNKINDPIEKTELIETSDIDNYARHAGMLTDRDIINFRRKQIGGKNLYEDSILKGFMVVIP